MPDVEEVNNSRPDPAKIMAARDMSSERLTSAISLGSTTQLVRH